jgi:hypothetical protein
LEQYNVLLKLPALSSPTVISLVFASLQPLLAPSYELQSTRPKAAQLTKH